MYRQPSEYPALTEILQRGGTVSLTGELTRCDRMTAMEVFEALGLDVSGSISSRTAFLLCGANPQQRKIGRSERDTVCNTVSILFARAHCSCICYCILNCKLYL